MTTLPNQPEDVLVASAKVRGLCGDVADMTIWRWLQDPKLAFPKPVYIGNRRYWYLSEIVAWRASRPRTMDRRRQHGVAGDQHEAA